MSTNTKAFELSILRIGCLIAKNNKFSFLVNGKELIQKLWNCFSPYLEISDPGSPVDQVVRSV